MTPRSTSRRKRTRYLSLRRRLAAAASAARMVSSLLSPSATSDRVQLDLFPLHPSTTTLEDDPHDEQISRFFPSDDAVTIHSLLGTQYSSSPAASEGKHSPSSSSASYSACSSSYGSVGGAVAAAAAGLARAALRGRERWWWAEEEEEEGEAASCGAAGLLSGATRRLSLRLDYDGILNAWSGERPPFIEGGDGPQVVPDLRRTTAPLQYATVFVDVSGCGGGLWTVPDGGAGSGPATEGGGEGGGGGRRAEEEGDVGEGQGEGEEGMAAGGREDREARVMRYKEKRRHRLFAKRIRYEVRKLNAEKRPRVKGRFVKRHDDV